jgi:hypothetical protein
LGGLIVVRQNRINHDKIKNLLADIRRMRATGAFAPAPKSTIPAGWRPRALACAPPGPWHASHCRPPCPKGPRGSLGRACAVRKIVRRGASLWQLRQVSAPLAL